ncbi:sugar transferase [Carboxylicivirga marina]|uniref:Sugar transferase n=1 Tax=Carboxylicivirga marina TaxID=2800988 RepID=A0ABS1HPY7_9BACT|nr:sugar transferase [Carboxylicivirga marina]MBK3519741.1 sugar transferase [Carboxylicivirga marina]
MRNIESIGAIGVTRSIEQVEKKRVQETVVQNSALAKKTILNSVSKDVKSYFLQHVSIDSISTAVINDNSHPLYLSDNQQDIRNVINVRQINDVRYINKYLCQINKYLPDAGILIGCVESTSNRKQKLFKGQISFWKRLYWLYCFIIHRVWPKVPNLKKLYFFLTKGKYRWLTIAEVLGRVVSCGFDIIEFKEIDGKVYFVVMKTHDPDHNMHPSYAPVFPMKRVGKNGKLIKVYKFRTMHPYSEYLQDYVIRLNGYNEVGKPANDFRLTRWGRFFRKYWLDELPQILNVLIGNMSIVGMRPLSQTRFNELPEDVKRMRVKFKPGCIPPYVALNMPDSENNIEAERIYMKAKKRSPFLTDVKYFFQAFYNIFSGKISSS